MLSLVVARLSLALPLPSPCFRFIWNPLMWFSPFFFVFSDLYVRTCYSVQLRILRNPFLLFWFFLWVLNLVLGHAILYIPGIFLKSFLVFLFKFYILVFNSSVHLFNILKTLRTWKATFFKFLSFNSTSPMGLLICFDYVIILFYFLIYSYFLNIFHF